MLAGLRKDGLDVSKPTILSIQGRPPPLCYQLLARVRDGGDAKVSAIRVSAQSFGLCKALGSCEARAADEGHDCNVPAGALDQNLLRVSLPVVELALLDAATRRSRFQ